MDSSGIALIPQVTTAIDRVRPTHDRTSVHRAREAQGPLGHVGFGP